MLNIFDCRSIVTEINKNNLELTMGTGNVFSFYFLYQEYIVETLFGINPFLLYWN